MCRISAIIHADRVQIVEGLERMNKAMRRGGPDDEGIYVDSINQVGLGHRRLSIIELSSAGHQPMEHSQELIISFNGEIYNYKALRQELLLIGHEFNTLSDTEVLLVGFKEWGTALFGKLKGMYAFVLYDKANEEVYAVRDHAGIKPLYYGSYKGRMYFSSEIRGIIAAEPDWEEDENWQVRFLAFGFIPEPYSTLQDVFHLPRGSYMKYNVSLRSFVIEQFVNFEFTSVIDNETAAISETKRCLLEAVERHLVADVPVGIFLSGGLDSTLLTVACRHFQKDKIRSLSIYFDDQEYSEKHYQELVAEKTGVEHQGFKVSKEDFEQAIPEIMEAMDQPSVDGINTFLICKYAKENGFKVVLSGLGADELFGGYKFFNDRSYATLRKFRIPVALLALFLQKYPNKKLRYLSSKHSIVQYLINRGSYVPDDIGHRTSMPIEKVWHILEQTGNDCPNNMDENNKISFLEQSLYMQSQLLRDSDVYSMWHGIELRVPFLDIEIIRLAYKIKPEIKFKVARKKFLLVEAFRDEIPVEIIDRKKMGFTFPFSDWFHNIRFPQKLNATSIQNGRDLFVTGKINWSRYWNLILVDKFKRSFK